MSEIPESVQKRINLIKSAEDSDALKKCLCPFYQKGEHHDCPGCLQTEKDLDDCKDDYLTKIAIHPMDIWNPEFDEALAQVREKISFDEAVNLGTTCDQCYMYDKCPYYRSGFTCKIDWGSNKPSTPEAMYDFLIDLQYKRVKRASVFEQVDGGVPDAGLSGEMDRLDGLIVDKSNLSRERFSVNVEATGSASGGGGILAKIFGGGGGDTKAIESKPSEPIDLPVEEAEYEEIKKTKRKSKKDDKI